MIETRIEVSQVPSLCADSATRISALDANEPLFLIRGSSSFQAGPLDSVFYEPRFIYPAEAIDLTLDSGAYFGFRAYGSATPAVGEVFVDDYQIVHFQGTRTQTLAEFMRIDWDGPPLLIWAGDLDLDGSPDALFDLRTHYAGHRCALFLSSSADGEELVGRAADFVFGGC